MITNKKGLHARPAAHLVRLVKTKSSKVEIIHNGNHADGRNIMSLLMLVASQNTRILVEAEGEDATEVLDEIGELIDSRFGESE